MGLLGHMPPCLVAYIWEEERVESFKKDLVPPLPALPLPLPCSPTISVLLLNHPLPAPTATLPGLASVVGFSGGAAVLPSLLAALAEWPLMECFALHQQQVYNSGSDLHCHTGLCVAVLSTIGLGCLCSQETSLLCQDQEPIHSSFSIFTIHMLWSELGRYTSSLVPKMRGPTLLWM